MTILVMISMLIGGALLQTLIPSSALLGEARVPVLGGLIIYYALTRSRSFALWVAILAGILQDSLCLIPLGYSALLFCLITIGVNLIKEEVFVLDWKIQALLGGLLNMLIAIGLFLLLTSSGVLISWTMLVPKLIGALVLGLFIVPFVFLVGSSFERKLGVAPAVLTS